MRKGWESKPLGDVCSFLNRGVSPKYVERGGVQVLNQRCVRDHRVSYDAARRHDVSAKRVADERLLQAGDVLVNSTGTGTLGRVAQLRDAPSEPSTVDSHVTIVRPKPGLFYQDFFGYMLWDIEDQIAESGEGCGGQTELNRSVLAERFHVRFPVSIPEQKRIVGILDEALTDVAIATANAEKNAVNAHAIFESHLETVFTRRGAGWIAKPLGEFAEFRNGINYTRSSTGEAVRVVGVRHFQSHFYAPMDDLDTVRIDGRLSQSDELRADDILAVRSNGNAELIGRTVLVGAVPSKTSHSGFTIRIRLSEGTLLPKYLCYFMKAANSRSLLTEGGTGTNIKSLNQGTLSTLIVPFPPLSEQRRIVETLDRLSGGTQGLAALYEKKRAAADALKQSLLHRAFTGQL